MKKRDKPRGDVIRTFICIEIPDSIQERIGRLQDELRPVKALVSWTKPSNIHLTLKFLGGVQASRIERVHKAVERAAVGMSPFEIEVGGAGCFPSARNPRVPWVGLSQIPEPLKQLSGNLEDELERLGFAREKRKFSPHLTIGRLREPKNAQLVAEKLTGEGFDPEPFLATEVIVMRSDLKPTGSIYTPQAIINLG
jgi:2'-5' RNA ligase